MPCVVSRRFYAARIARLTRSSVLDTLNEEFVLTARAKGLAEWIVIGKHTLQELGHSHRDARRPRDGPAPGRRRHHRDHLRVAGLGRLTVQALLNRDFPVVLAAVFVISSPTP
jgi:peptide/nickel transport system permease protein